VKFTPVIVVFGVNVRIVSPPPPAVMENVPKLPAEEVITVESPTPVFALIITFAQILFAVPSYPITVRVPIRTPPVQLRRSIADPLLMDFVAL
jgi:hypothetical protein